MPSSSTSRSTRITGTPLSRRRTMWERSSVAGVTRMPLTRCSRKRSRYDPSRCALSSLLPRSTVMPASAARSSAPRATSAKKGLPTSRTTMPMLRLRPARSCRAASLRTKPSSSIACWTRSTVDGDTFEGRFRTLETVPTETDAAAATSRTLTTIESPSLFIERYRHRVHTATISGKRYPDPSPRGILRRLEGPRSTYRGSCARL